MQEQGFDLASLAGSEQTPFVQAHCISASPPTLNVSREKQAAHTCTRFKQNKTQYPTTGNPSSGQVALLASEMPMVVCSKGGVKAPEMQTAPQCASARGCWDAQGCSACPRHWHHARVAASSRAEFPALIKNPWAAGEKNFYKIHWGQHQDFAENRLSYQFTIIF